MAAAKDRAGRRVVVADAATDYVLGLSLLTMPRRTAELLGLPVDERGFYQRVLGGVLTGVATARAVEHRRRDPSGPAGLGATDAIAVNACGGGAVALWLAFSDGGSIPARGRALLRTVAGGVLAFGAIEAWGEIKTRS